MRSKRFAIDNRTDRRRERFGARAELDIYLGLLCTGALLFIQAFHAPGNASIGLDPSWRLALGEAHVAGLQFGKDIVFTFGPLGYLTYGLPIAATYGSMLAASFAVALVCAALGTTLVAQPKIPIAVRLVFVLALAVVLPQASESLYLVTILFWLLPVFRARGHFPLAATALGAFSAIVGLTEFKVAFVAFAGGVLLFGGRAFMEYRVRAGASGVPSLVCFVCAYCVVYGYSFAAHDYGPIVTLAFVALAAIALAFSVRPQFAPALGGRVFAATALVLGLALALSPSCRAYAIASARIASGYSVAMSVPGARSELNLALCGLSVLALLAAVHLKWLTSPVAAAMALGAFGAFKEGFVRQDPPHVLFFFVVLVPITAAVALLSSRRTQILSLACCALVLVLYDVVFHSYSLGDVVASSVAPASIAGRAASVAQSMFASPFSQGQYVAGLAGDVFPKSVQAEVGSESANVLPWETAAIFANGFTWDPEPVFQSYSVFGSAVDGTNAAHREKDGASRVFYQWAAIDGRYPLWDEPAASAVLLCRYRLAEVLPSVVATASGNAFLALKRTTDRCGRSVSSETMHVTWNERIPVPRLPGLTYAKLSIRYNALGYLTRTLFRIPAVDVTVDSGLATAATFRIVSETSEDGILIDPLPEGLIELGNLFSNLGGKIHPTRSFSIETEAPYLYQSGIDVRFESVAYEAP